jgi:DNA polymerase III epsilon subunit-like protein
MEPATPVNHPPGCACIKCFIPRKTVIDEEEYRCLIHDAINPCPFCAAELIKKGIDPKGAIGATKPPLALLPPAFNEEVAKALSLGARKYGTFNWRETKVEMMSYLHAMRRHLDEVIERIDIDPESGAHHLGHVAANCAIILDARKHGTLVDNRPPQP